MAPVHSTDEAGRVIISNKPLKRTRAQTRSQTKALAQTEALPQSQPASQLERPRKRQKRNPNIFRDYKSSQKPFRLMDLPAEIRLQVYSWIILHRQATRPSYAQSTRMHNIFGFGHGPVAESAITRVNKMVRKESMPVFYKLRRFPLLNAPLPVALKATHLFKNEKPLAPSYVVKKIPTAKIPMLGSFAIELVMPGHRDDKTTTRCNLSIDLLATGHEMWLSTSWGDGRYALLDKYWKRVMTRKGSGVVPLMDKLRLQLDSMKEMTTRQDLIDLAVTAMEQSQGADGK